MPTSSPSSKPPAPRTACELLAGLWPALSTYCPRLSSVSAPQAAFLVLDCEEAFYGGAVGGGKTAALLMAALQYVDVPGYAALILRRTFPELEQPGNLIAQSHEWFAQVPQRIRPVYSTADHEWRFPSGAVIRFGHLDSPNAMLRYQGGGYHLIGFDELTHFDERSYEFIALSRTRRPQEGPLARVPMRVRSTANPGGPGHGWVKRRFVDKPAPGVVFVPARLRDNPGIDHDDYEARLRKLSPALASQLLEGDWGAFEGAAYTLRDEHLVPAFEVPEPWERFESMDFGVANPTCVLAWAVDYDGNCVVFDSYYQADTLVSDHAKAIEAKRGLWWPQGRRPVCHADPSMWARTGRTDRWGQPATDVTEFQEHGIDGLVQANNKRRPGRVRVAELLKPDDARRFPSWHPRAGEPGSPRMFVVADRCPELVEQLRDAPLLPIDSGKEGAGEIVDPDWESHHGHAVAACRYGAMSRPAPSLPEQPADTPRDEFIARHRGRLEERARNPRAPYVIV